MFHCTYPVKDVKDHGTKIVSSLEWRRCENLRVRDITILAQFPKTLGLRLSANSFFLKLPVGRKKIVAQDTSEETSFKSGKSS